MLCSLHIVDDVAFVRVSDDIYLNNQEEFDSYLQQQICPVYSKIVLDVADVKNMCSAALGAIVKAHKRARESGGEVVFIRVQKKVQTLLEITRLTNVLKVLDDEPAAEEYLRSLR